MVRSVNYSLFKFQSEAEVIARVNATEFSLAAYVYGREGSNMDLEEYLKLNIHV